jgi:cytidylate kinase
MLKDSTRGDASPETARAPAGMNLLKLSYFAILTGRKLLDSWRVLKRIVIAIDGPAASGKSTTARFVAERLGYLHVDTGAMYRAVALKVLQEGISPTDAKAVERIVDSTEVTQKAFNGHLRTFLDGVDVTEKIRSRDVATASSLVSANRKVREAMVKEQRSLGKDGGVVLEGRDIGTVVFPNAKLKIFLTASLDERARRRQRELHDQGTHVDLQSVRDELAHRDTKDATRDASPLVKASEAIEIDTSSMSIGEQVNLVVEKAREIIEEEN